MSRELSSLRRWIGSAALLGTIGLIAGLLTAWKASADQEAEAGAANQPEPVEAVTAAVVEERLFRETTTAIGTVLALRSITLRNELPGTVREVMLVPGRIVEAGALLVALDVSVEEADLRAQEARAALARTTLERLEHLKRDGATSDEAVDQARAERDVALAQIERTRAIIARKTLRAPFRARVGIANVHAGQYLNEGTALTTLQGVADAAHVDFSVSQQVAAGLRAGDAVEVVADGAAPAQATIVAVDARVDPTTRSAMVRARIAGGSGHPAPGASVQVVVPVGPESRVAVVPVSALRKRPAGDHVFVLSPGEDGRTRAHVRPVRSGPMVGDEVVILEGLAGGEQVAASGSFKLRESAAVQVAEVRPPAAPAGSPEASAGGGL